MSRIVVDGVEYTDLHVDVTTPGGQLIRFVPEKERIELELELTNVLSYLASILARSPKLTPLEPDEDTDGLLVDANACVNRLSESASEASDDHP